MKIGIQMSIFIFCENLKLISNFSRAIIGQRGTLPVRPLGYLNFKKVIFRTMRTMRKQFPVTQLTSGEVEDFRETRFHPKKMAAKVEQCEPCYG